MTSLQERPITSIPAITELDLYRADADHLTHQYPDYVGDGRMDAWTERQEEAEEERAYWDEVMSCCKGTDWNCSHWRSYAALDDRFTYREDW